MECSAREPWQAVSFGNGDTTKMYMYIFNEIVCTSTVFSPSTLATFVLVHSTATAQKWN